MNAFKNVIRYLRFITCYNRLYENVIQSANRSNILFLTYCITSFLTCLKGLPWTLVNFLWKLSLGVRDKLGVKIIKPFLHDMLSDVFLWKYLAWWDIKDQSNVGQLFHKNFFWQWKGQIWAQLDQNYACSLIWGSALRKCFCSIVVWHNTVGRQ